jgi:hypothetical protein
MEAYSLLLTLHSYLRWAVVILAVIVVIRALLGVSQKTAFTAADNRNGLFFMISADTQLLLGLLLYFWASPITAQARADFGAAMKNPELRFWGVEHITGMLIAWVLIHVGRSRSKKARTDLAKHRAALIFYGIAILLVLVSIPWASRPLFRT